MPKANKVLAIIPARGRSKRLPQKNILELAGKPMIAWTIEAALKSKYIDEVVVSTDDKIIAEISKKFGAKIPFMRPKELANDTTTTIEVIIHVISSYQENFEYIILLQPTSPLRTTDDIDRAFEMLDEKTQAIVSVCETEHSPLWSNILPDDRSMKDFIRPEIKNLRSQDLPIFYRLNGAIYISETNHLIHNESFLTKNTKAFIMLQNKSLDIDNELDFDLVKNIINGKS